LFREFRAFMLRKCRPDGRARIGSILEKESFGELERLLAQKLLEVAKGLATEHAGNEKWIARAARLNKTTREQTRAMLRKLIKTDVFNASVENFITFLDRLIESWNIDPGTFGVEIVVTRELPAGGLKRFEFTEREPNQPARLEPGLKEFLRDKTLSGDATKDEVEFLKKLDLKGRRPVPIYYYRELQNLRDPVHFRSS